MRVWDNYKAQLNLNHLEAYVFAENRSQWVNENCDKDSEDYWYYRLLDLQRRSTGQAEAGELEEALANVKSSEVIDSERIQRLLFRQAVTDFSSGTAEEVANWIQDVTEPRLDHAQESDKIPQRPTEYKSTLQLDTKAIQTELYNNLSGADLRDVFTPESAVFLAERKLSATQIAQYLELIEDEAPDVPFILTLVKKDLQQAKFGSRRIHVKLSRDQLETLANKSENLWEDDTFLFIYGWKLRAVSDADLRFDLNARLKYFTALKDFALSRIPNNVNASFKALILFNYLTLQEKLGYYDVDVFRQYLAVPKAKFVRYAPDEGKKKKKGRNNPSRFASFDYTVEQIPELEAIGDDLDFVTRTCHDMFLNGEKPSNWRSALDETFGQPIFAEEMLAAGRGSSSTIPGVEKFQESQQNVLRRFKGPEYFEKTLRPRVDLRLTPDNKAVYSVADTVNLKLFVKNVPTLTYEVYEVNERSWFITKGIEVPAEIGIDGANPFVVKSMDFGEPALMKKTRIVEIPELRGKRGGFVVDIKGGGMECRALIKKGEYRYVAEQSPEGFVFKVLNELNEEVPTGRIQMDGVDYYADQQGEIVLPFSEEEDRIAKVVVDDHTTSGGAASLHFFEQTGRHYRLDFGIYIDRETILEKREAAIIIRPNLYLNEETVSAQHNLRDTQVTITTTNELGEEVSRVVPIKVRDDQETIQNFIVPTECRAVTVVFKAFLISTGQEFNNYQKFNVNNVDDERVIADIFLFPYGRAGYVLACQGKNGEPFPNRVIDLEIQHRMVKDPLQFTLETDANGRVYLGRLPDVMGVKAATRDDNINKEESFNLLEDMCNVPRVVNSHKDSIVRIPYPSVRKDGPKVMIYDTAFIKSFSSNSAYRKGYIEISGLGTGDYVVFIRDQISADVLLNITDGPIVSDRFGNYALGTSRFLQLSEDYPLQITNVKGSREKGYTIRLNGFNDKTRVHIISTSFVPAFNAFSFLASPTVDPDVLDFPDYELSEYLPQKELKAEYTYIQARRDQPKVVGNLLPKPGLIINRSNAGSGDKGEKAQKFAPEAAPLQLKINKRYGKKQRKDNVSTAGRQNEDKSNLEFLLEPSRVYPNVEIQEDGTVLVSTDMISEQNNLIQIVAVDDDNTAIRNVILEESREPQAFKDVRLSDIGLLDPEKLFVEKRQVLPLQPGDSYTVDDVRYADFEAYFDLSQVIELYRALGADKDARAADVMAAFRFIGNWDQFSQEDKLDKYGGFACNELNYFLYNKDPQFFGDVVKPVIQSKLQKTFFDLYLLEDISITEYVHKSDKYFSLNAFERIILAKRVSSQVGLTRATLKTFKEAADLQVVLPQETDRQFDVAIANSLLSGELCDAWIKSHPKPTLLQKDGTILDTADDADNDSVINEVIEIVANTGDAITTTKENQEQTYFQVPWSECNCDLIKPSRFWNDYARFALGQSGQENFISKYFIEATNNVNEMLLALAVLDVPCTAPAPQKSFSANLKSATITATNATILFAKEIKEGQYHTSQLSLNTNFYDPSDPHEDFDGETVDKFMTGRDFQTSRIYGVRVVVTNVSSVQQSFELLVQIPEGSIGTTGGFTTKNIPVQLEKFGTFRLEYEFYFPQPGEFRKAPVMMTKHGKVVGKGLEPAKLKVAVVPAPVDRSSWTYISQQADSEEVLSFLAQSPDIYKVDLNRICWRLNDPAFYKGVTDTLRKRQCYHENVWAYGLRNADSSQAELGEYLAQNESFQEAVKPYFISDLVKYDPIDGLDYQYLEYTPLVKQRYHKMSIETDEFLRQYNEFLLKAAYSSTNVNDLSTEDKMILTAYLIMQDRAVDAVSIFTRISEEEAYHVSDLAYDLQKAYLSFFDADTPGDDAFDVYEKYKISTLLPSKMALLEKMRVALVEMGDPARADDDFDAIQLAAKKDGVVEKLDFEKGGDHSITFTYSNLTEITLNFYVLNVEVNFSEQPFEVLANGFTLITPNESTTIQVPEIPPGQSGTFTYNLEQSMINHQFVLEAKSGGVTVAKQCYDNELCVQTAPKLGEMRVLDRETNQPMEQVYCKVFGRRKDNGQPIFYKDGYTDMRGRFNYSKRNDNQIGQMSELVGLAYTDSFGALIFNVPFPTN